MKNHHNRWRVQLGEEFALQYTYARLDGDPLRLLGSVSRGLQTGALAQTSDGRYAQLNGDYVTPLCNSQLQRAVNAAQLAPVLPAVWRKPTAAPPAPPVVVIVKRSRTLAPPRPQPPDPNEQKVAQPQIASKLSRTWNSNAIQRGQQTPEGLAPCAQKERIKS